MQDIRQVQLMSQVISKQREKQLAELARVNSHIHKKMELIHKMSGYLNDYSDENRLQISRSIPALSKNLLSFSKKIEVVIIEETKEVDRLKEIRSILVKEIESIEKKLDLMATFEEKIKQELAKKLERLEQIALDEMTSNKHSRGDND